MATKKLLSNLILKGITPNLLINDIEITAPFIFNGELNLQGPNLNYLIQLNYYKKNLKLLKHIDLSEYFYLCCSAHWATAGTYVPTNVDNQIREGLWKHEKINSAIEKMVKITMDAWNWDYQQVTNRKSYHPKNDQVLSTHEGTWLSVAIGAYNALLKNKRLNLAMDMEQIILAEIEKEEKILIELQAQGDHINFLRTCALIAHNFGDLDRVIEQWQMPEDNLFRKRIFKLGHKLNLSYSPIIAFAGQVNKAFLSVENHRHMSLRAAKCLRKSNKFLIPIGPFMDEWGKILGESSQLSLQDKGEIIIALFEGFKRQDHAFGYARVFAGLISNLPEGLKTLEAYIPFDVVIEIKKSLFKTISDQNQEEFIQSYKNKLNEFICPLTNMNFLAN
jgi:hypothetical protein